jgi:hypothetical protein
MAIFNTAISTQNQETESHLSKGVPKKERSICLISILDVRYTKDTKGMNKGPHNSEYILVNIGFVLIRIRYHHLFCLRLF